MLWRPRKTRSKFAFSFEGYVENFTDSSYDQALYRVVQSTPNNSNLALTRTKIDFPLMSSIHNCNFILGNSNPVKARGKSKKNRALQSETLNLFQNNHVFFEFLFQNVIVIMECVILAFLPHATSLFSCFWLFASNLR